VTLISAYIELFIRGEKSGGGECPGEMSGYLKGRGGVVQVNNIHCLIDCLVEHSGLM